jgi:hypothetical protein
MFILRTRRVGTRPVLSGWEPARFRGKKFSLSVSRASGDHPPPPRGVSGPASERIYILEEILKFQIFLPLANFQNFENFISSFSASAGLRRVGATLRGVRGAPPVLILYVFLKKQNFDFPLWGAPGGLGSLPALPPSSWGGRGMASQSCHPLFPTSVVHV